MSITRRNDTDEDRFAQISLKGVFNGRVPPRVPRAVVRVSSLDDVLAGVALAIREQCGLAVRSGGHSLPVWSLQEDSVLLDLGGWKKVDIDLPEGRAMVTPAVTSKELNDALAPRGLVSPGAHCPHVGLGGFLLQGGMGWNAQGWGWGSEAVQAVQAARGAGPAFPAIVICFQLQARPYTPQGVFSSTYIYPWQCYRPVFEWALSVSPMVGPDTEIKILSYYPYDRKEICLLAQFITTQETAEHAQGVLREIHNTRPPGFLSQSPVQPESLENLYAIQARICSPGYRYCSDNGFLKNGIDIISVLEKAFLTLPHRRSAAFWTPMAPRSREPLTDMALSIQSDNYFALYAVWEAEQDDDRCTQWAHGFVQSISRHCVGSYIGEADPERRRGRFWTDESLHQLAAVRRRWDPQGRLSSSAACDLGLD
ncbi:hypothetical protein FE257_008263 [Aspergillus nanangensis]|uniref:FAD-binding PCMH-type domain-containing protein n=1 Tax=Aspergillus nanangensis TaxID=2582783 RepID=A0AAD4CMD2_ASPNN|nr:hypothetical protein FE257_008263 [Aspergillus nanangensis]